ncbi:hypothetical protein P886_0512 [Alteromonadaceae bacterium 2753L.S.0a.02]|nr:hypothetical protein P886_0512 [Alteromonadaceae bacterium 2753L.S.0a.02]
MICFNLVSIKVKTSSFNINNIDAVINFTVIQRHLSRFDQNAFYRFDRLYVERNFISDRFLQRSLLVVTANLTENVYRIVEISVSAPCAA